MKRYFLPQAKFLQQLPTKKEVEEILEAPVENVVEVVTNEFDEKKETSKKSKKNKRKKK